jgi:chaperone modulatory protein CbpM
MREEVEIISGLLLDEQTRLNLRELCGACGIHAELVIEMVSEGIAEPIGSNPVDWRFDGPAVKRVQRALRLQRDLGVNLAGAALALDLLEELEELRRIHVIYRRIY